MTPEQIIKHYGGEQEAAIALGITRQAVNFWKRRRQVPVKMQALIQLKTAGALKARIAT